MARPLVLFDLGGPLLKNGWEEGYDPVPMSVCQALGIDVNSARLDALVAEAVNAYGAGPSPYILWQLVRPDRAAFDHGMALIWAHYDALGVPPLQDGLVELLDGLDGRYALGILSNYDVVRQREFLAEHHLERFFPALLELSYRKPDPRAFLTAIEHYGGTPETTVVVGDRLDNDIAPANRLGAHTIWLKSGTFAGQRPRTPWDEATRTVESLDGLAQVIDDIAAGLEVTEAPGTEDHAASQREPLYRAGGCFACGTKNAYGLDMAPYLENGEVFCEVTPKSIHRGWSKLVHGGILATILDEVVCMAAAQSVGRKVLTVKAEVRYRAPAFVGRTLYSRAWPTGTDGRYETAKGEITDAKGRVLAEGTLFCLPVDGDKAAQFLNKKGASE